MSKVTLSAMSFVAGMLCMFFIASGSHTSTLAQAPTPAPLGPLGADIESTGGVPVVPPIMGHFNNFGVEGRPSILRADGVECNGCNFTGITFKYGGGNFQFSRFSVSGPIRYELDGAAKNTVIFLALMQALANAEAPKKPANAPKIQIVNVNGTVKGDIGTGQ